MNQVEFLKYFAKLLELNVEAMGASLVGNHAHLNDIRENIFNLSEEITKRFPQVE